VGRRRFGTPPRCVFQATLLAGYGYVHFVNLKLPPRKLVMLHLAVIAVAFVSLPVAVRGGYDPDQDPTLGLIALLGNSIGLPFFAVSATAPLFQRWFALSGHRHAGDPFFLYGASNLGSILALLAFPFFLEPTLSLREQGVAWTGGFAVLLLLIGLCALIPASKAASWNNAPTRAQTLYHRFAYLCPQHHGLRITYDTRLQCSEAIGLPTPPEAFHYVEPPNKTLIELKYNYRCPAWLINAAETLELERISFSKYAECMDRSLSRTWLPAV
jgi:hypothetical protein